MLLSKRLRSSRELRTLFFLCNIFISGKWRRRKVSGVNFQTTQQLNSGENIFTSKVAEAGMC